MMKYLSIFLFSLTLSACNSIYVSDNKCPGNAELPGELAGLFDTIEDESLLKSALDIPNNGNLCQGKVYKTKKNVDITIYRSWNSTNPNSRLGHWWSFSRPNGNISKYRTDFEICYQFSPLDKLTHCNLKEGSKLVVGTGQSMTCSDYLTYLASASKQIYIKDAASSLSNCKDYDALFSWRPVIK